MKVMTRIAEIVKLKVVLRFFHLYFLSPFSFWFSFLFTVSKKPNKG